MDFFVGNFADWFNSYAKDKLFRLWYKEDEKLGPDDGYDGVCQYVYLRQAINLGNDWLIGYAVFDEREKDNMYPSLNWAKLSEIDLAWYKDDEENNFPLYMAIQFNGQNQQLSPTGKEFDPLYRRFSSSEGLRALRLGDKASNRMICDLSRSLKGSVW